MKIFNLQYFRNILKIADYKTQYTFERTHAHVPTEETGEVHPYIIPNKLCKWFI